MVEFKVREKDRNMYVLEVVLDGPITPGEAARVAEESPAVSGPVLLCISGRAPIWLYAMLLHRYMHSVAAVATYDPKIGGCVIVASHTRRYREGEVVKP